VDLYLKLERADLKNANLHLYKNFFYPLNVTTPDQLILAMMNHSRYNLKSFLMRFMRMIPKLLALLRVSSDICMITMNQDFVL
jgi:hypothetical protein